MNVLIVEDEVLAANHLLKLLEEQDHSVKICGIIDSVEATIRWLNANPLPDLIFLDIQLADGMSFSIFDRIKIEVPVIFTTAYDAYAIKAFDLNSIDYLLKPVDEERLSASLAKFKKIKQYYGKENDPDHIEDILKKLSLQTPVFKTRFLVNKGESLIPVSVEEIAFFYAEEKGVFLVTSENKQYLINYNLEILERTLNPVEFFRVNRQFIVSAHSIKKVHNYFNYKLKLDIIPVTDKEIVVSKAKTTEFKNWMNR
jgi:two-component system, LytTR family, response regulator LytT